MVIVLAFLQIARDCIATNAVQGIWQAYEAGVWYQAVMCGANSTHLAHATAYTLRVTACARRVQLQTA
jgi:hypothetical protein